MSRGVLLVPTLADVAAVYVTESVAVGSVKHWFCVTRTLAGEYVGLEEVDDGLWDVYFGPVKLGRMNERILRIEDHKGRTVRRRSPANGDPADAM